MPPWKKRLVAVMYGEMARNPLQVPEPERICCVDGSESPVSQTKNGESVHPPPGWALRRAEASQPVTGTEAEPPVALDADPTVPKAAPSVKRTSAQPERSSRPDAPSQPRLLVPVEAAFWSAASRREAAR